MWSRALFPHAELLVSCGYGSRPEETAEGLAIQKEYLHVEPLQARIEYEKVEASVSCLGTFMLGRPGFSWRAGHFCLLVPIDSSHRERSHWVCLEKP
jgi:hypothetical protein